MFIGVWGCRVWDSARSLGSKFLQKNYDICQPTSHPVPRSLPRCPTCLSMRVSCPSFNNMSCKEIPMKLSRTSYMHLNTQLIKRTLLLAWATYQQKYKGRGKGSLKQTSPKKFVISVDGGTLTDQCCFKARRVVVQKFFELVYGYEITGVFGAVQRNLWLRICKATCFPRSFMH